MKRTLPAFILALSGCVMVQTDDPVGRQRFTDTVPECASDGCGPKWAAAKDWMERNLKLPLSDESSDLLRTADPTGAETGGTVRKMCGDNGRCRLVVTLWCENKVGCSVPPKAAQLWFNDFVNAR